jgi:hypothetical protein
MINYQVMTLNLTGRTKDSHRTQNAGESIFPGVVFRLVAGARYLRVRERIKGLFLRKWHPPRQGRHS